jgi:hypothetical protein
MKRRRGNKRGAEEAQHESGESNFEGGKNFTLFLLHDNKWICVVLQRVTIIARW